MDLRGQATKQVQWHAPSIPVYMDGLKSATRVGCAAIFPDFETFISLLLMTSNFTAERTLSYSWHSLESPLTMAPRSSFTRIPEFYTGHALVLKIQHFLAGLHFRCKAVYFFWVPSHVGLPGNEMTDCVAKQASLHPPSKTLSLPHSRPNNP